MLGQILTFLKNNPAALTLFVAMAANLIHYGLIRLTAPTDKDKSLLHVLYVGLSLATALLGAYLNGTLAQFDFSQIQSFLVLLASVFGLHTGVQAAKAHLTRG